MNCPTCNVTLLLAEKQGVEIDYCPQCRGIWLDRGELEKIIEKSNQYETPALNIVGRLKLSVLSSAGSLSLSPYLSGSKS